MPIEVRPFITGYAQAYALIGEKTILVDAGSKGDEASMKEALNSVGVKPEDVSLIIITHNHPDHTAALPALRRITGAPVLSHRIAAESFKEGWGEAIVPRTVFASLLIRLMPKSSEQNRRPQDVDIAISEETDLTNYGLDARIIPTPGHTAGSISVITGDGDAVIGDLVMKFGIGRPVLSMFSDDEEKLLSSLKGLLDRNVRAFYLAHGGLLSRDKVEGLVEAFSLKRQYLRI